jgi:hypothetical protein
MHKGRSIAQILTHIFSVVAYYQNALHNGLQERVPDPDYGNEADREEWRTYYDEAFYRIHLHERAWYEEFLARAYATYMNALLALTDADLETVCTTNSGKQRTVEWILHQVPGHTDYHIGQINYMLGRYKEAVPGNQ